MKLKMMFMIAAAGALLPMHALAAHDVITAEDFEAYHTRAVYNTGTITVSYPGYADASMSSSVVVNAPGGIYGGDEAYTANAAQNMIAYAKTGDTTAAVVPGGLGNGWEGRYSHPVTGIDSSGGANAHMNQYNRRCSVVEDGAGKALQICSDNNIYVNTFALYAYDDVDFSGTVLWESDVKVRGIAAGGAAALSLTKGKMDEAQLFSYVSRPMGRTDILDIVSFDSDRQILINGQAAGRYETGEYYRVSVLIDPSGTKPVYSVTVKNRSTGEIAAQSQPEILEYDFKGVTGIEYYCNSLKNAASGTDILVDNIDVSAVTLVGEILSTRAVAINGSGVSVIVFDDDVEESTVSAETVRVYLGDTPLEGAEVSLNNTKQVRLTLPELEPSAVYRVEIRGVKSQSGIMASCDTGFKTMDLITVSAAQANSGGAAFRIKNNAANECSVTGMAVFYKGGKIVSDGVHYKKITIPAGQTISENFVGMQAQESWDNVSLFFINSITGGFQAVAPQVTIQ